MKLKIKSTNEWFSNNLLELKLTKSKQIIFNIKYTIQVLSKSCVFCLINNYINCNTYIGKVNSIKYPGNLYYIDSWFKWKIHTCVTY